MPSIKKGLARTPTPPEPQPLGAHPGVMAALREVGPVDCDGGREKYRLRWRQLVVRDGLGDDVREALRELRRRGFTAPPINGDELEPPPGSTRRGVPAGYAGDDERLCNAKTRTGRPCRALALPNGRCVRHGGRSTGPRTAAGLARSALNLVKANSALAAKRRKLP